MVALKTFALPVGLFAVWTHANAAPSGEALASDDTCLSTDTDCAVNALQTKQSAQSAHRRRQKKDLAECEIVKGVEGTNECPIGAVDLTKKECLDALNATSGIQHNPPTVENHWDPKACFQFTTYETSACQGSHCGDWGSKAGTPTKNQYIYFNENVTGGSPYEGRTPVCKKCGNTEGTECQLSDVEYYGEGCCRFWGYEPIHQGMQTLDACKALCNSDPKCTAMDVRDPVDNNGDGVDEYVCTTFHGEPINFDTGCGNYKDEQCYKRPCY